MSELHPRQEHLLNCIGLEVQEQEHRYRIDPNEGLKKLRASGLLLHPISVTRKSFGYADYPEIEFRILYASETSLFKENSAIECFIEGEDAIKGVLIGVNGMKGTVRLFSSDFPDWIEEKGVGLKLAPDHRTSEVMSNSVRELQSSTRLFELFKSIHSNADFGIKETLSSTISFRNSQLNESQKNAVMAIQANEDLLVLHGPPGTGKTTTLVESIVQLKDANKRILVTAPSNTAVDNIAKGLIHNGVKILRVGNSLKIDEQIFSHTPEGMMRDSKEAKEIKKLKIKAEEFRRMSYQYKRNFGREDREQRNLLIREAKRLRKEIRDLKDYYEDKLYNEAEVILGTPIGLKNFLPQTAEFDVLVMDEAGQAIEPLAWTVFPFAKSWVLAGDPYQLPPTVLSEEAIKIGFNKSILEVCFEGCVNSFFLDTQYRMRASIASFSNSYFYEDRLLTPSSLSDKGSHVTFFDTAGTGYDEQVGKDGTSLINEGELSLVEKILTSEELSLKETALISPYSGQVNNAKEVLSTELRVSTIDSFQGQECVTVIISLVRSNPEGNIGFLSDYRRMNVALTRAQEKLIVIGDSSTIGQDKFFAELLEYFEKINEYRSAWELM